MLLLIVADVVFSDGKVTSYLHVGNTVYTVWNHRCPVCLSVCCDMICCCSVVSGYIASLILNP